MIGFIFGETSFPKEILKKAKQRKISYLIIDLTKKRVFKKDKNSYSASIGQFGKILKILKENKCSKVLFAGKVNKPKVSKLRLDFKGVYFITKILKAYKLGDAAILKEIIKILSKEKIKTISSLFLNPELTLKKGNHTRALYMLSFFFSFTLNQIVLYFFSIKSNLPPEIYQMFAMATYTFVFFFLNKHFVFDKT